MTVKYPSISCTKINYVSLRYFGDSISSTLKEYLGKNEINSNTTIFVKKKTESTTELEVSIERVETTANDKSKVFLSKKKINEYLVQCWYCGPIFLRFL